MTTVGATLVSTTNHKFDYITHESGTLSYIEGKPAIFTFGGLNREYLHTSTVKSVATEKELTTLTTKNSVYTFMEE